MVLAASCVVIVEVMAGRVMVDITVEAGNCEVMVLVTAGRVIVESKVLACSCVVWQRKYLV
jgi:hypothetical protein